MLWWWTRLVTWFDTCCLWADMTYYIELTWPYNEMTRASNGLTLSFNRLTWIYWVYAPMYILLLTSVWDLRKNFCTQPLTRSLTLSSLPATTLVFTTYSYGISIGCVLSGYKWNDHIIPDKIIVCNRVRVQYLVLFLDIIVYWIMFSS